ncbi:hypothetical protein BDN71DRAFT_1454621 [Pleurotus eryngii]|uniref:Uncharacterized protein n=1 Tax=Pleurotus eryngii TaxID=5323 RepID=A0A9P5ZNB5_PLEER|nr:hypothetical protein BDN71DRAFT_1454621 [Pleurotus eryngii]
MQRPTNLTCFPPRNGCSTLYGAPWHEYLVQFEACRACNVPIDDATKNSTQMLGSNDGRGRLSCHGRGHTLGPTPEPQISESITSERVACVLLVLLWHNTAIAQCRSFHKPMNSRTVLHRHHLPQHPHGTHQRPVQRPPGSTLSMYCPPSYTFILSDHKQIKILSSYEFALFPQAFD